MWVFKPERRTTRRALQKNRSAAIFIGAGLIILAATALLDFPPYRILRAAPSMPDKIFAQSIVLVMPQGLSKLGLILNRPLTPEQTAQLPAAAQAIITDYGGPVNFPQRAALLSWRPNQPPHLAEITLTLLAPNDLLAADTLREKIAGLRHRGLNVRLFAGYAGWSPLQLEMEMRLVHMWRSPQPAAANAPLDTLLDGSAADWARLP